MVLITIAHISRGSCFEICSFSFSLHLLDMFRLSDTIKRACGNVDILVTVVEKEILELKHQLDLKTCNIRYKKSSAGMSPCPFHSESEHCPV